MNNNQSFCRTSWVRLFALAWVASATAPAFAQDSATPATAKWRPKDGTYAMAGTEFANRCGEDFWGDITVEIAENSISGNEWSCKITKMTDRAPGEIRLDLSCNDYNLAEAIKAADPENKLFKEIMLLKRIDERTVLIHQTANGKFSAPRWKASYCPEEAQRMYIEAKARYRAEAARKADEERRSKSDHPRDGVYANPGANFEERCSKFGDAKIGLARESISIGADKCEILHSSDSPPDTVDITVICNENPDIPNFVVSSDGRRATVRQSPLYYMMLKKIDDNNVLFWRKENGHFTGPGQQLSYCGANVQREFARQSSKKGSGK
jgi:hypothetical protein